MGGPFLEQVEKDALAAAETSAVEPEPEPVLVAQAAEPAAADAPKEEPKKAAKKASKPKAK